jgi:hypothetical protein
MALRKTVRFPGSGMLRKPLLPVNIILRFERYVELSTNGSRSPSDGINPLPGFKLQNCVQKVEASSVQRFHGLFQRS